MTLSFNIACANKIANSQNVYRQLGITNMKNKCQIPLLEYYNAFFRIIIRLTPRRNHYHYCCCCCCCCYYYAAFNTPWCRSIKMTNRRPLLGLSVCRVAFVTCVTDYIRILQIIRKRIIVCTFVFVCRNVVHERLFTCDSYSNYNSRSYADAEHSTDIRTGYLIYSYICV